MKCMRVLVLSLNYAPEQTGYGPRVALLCEHLASKGHSITVLTGFPFMPYWSRYQEYRGKFAMREYVNGVEVVRLSHFIPRQPKRMIQRLYLEGSFSLFAALTLLRRWWSKWDVVVYVGTHPSIAMLAGIFANLRGLPYIVKITDLASELAFEVGIVKRGWLQKWLNMFEYAAYRRSQGAIVICEGFRRALVAHNYPIERIRIIFNSVDLDLIKPVTGNNGNGFRSKYNLRPEDFVLSFSGSMSRKQGLFVIIESARLLKANYPQVKWVLVGDGEQKSKLQELVVEYDLTEQVYFLPLQPEEQMKYMLSAADVLLLPQLGSITDTVIPGKLLTYLAAGRPVIATVNMQNQTAITLKEAGGGIIVMPENPSAMAAEIKRLLQVDPEILRIMGCRNREYAEQNFDNRKTLAKQEAFLEEIVSNTHVR